MLHLVMKPGAVIPAHVHKNVAEVLYIVEGDFINEGKQYEAGTLLHIKAGQAHGPHGTTNGCKLLVLWSEPRVEAVRLLCGRRTSAILNPVSRPRVVRKRNFRL